MTIQITPARLRGALVLAGLGLGLVPATAFAQTPRLTRAVMAKGVIEGKTGPSKPIGATTTFKPSDRKIYALYSLNKPVAGYGRSVWTAINVETLKPNTVIYDAKTASFPNFQYGKFLIANSVNWPRGQFKVALYVNKTYLKTLYFSVK